MVYIKLKKMQEIDFEKNMFKVVGVKD